jgi:hypothetical protein
MVSGKQDHKKLKLLGVLGEWLDEKLLIGRERDMFCWLRSGH